MAMPKPVRWSWVEFPLRQAKLLPKLGHTWLPVDVVEGENSSLSGETGVGLEFMPDQTVFAEGV
jgi:hypothetical protein